jgi:hypothetical protein
LWFLLGTSHLNDRKLQGVSPNHFSPEVAQDFAGKFKAGNSSSILKIPSPKRLRKISWNNSTLSSSSLSWTKFEKPKLC